MIDTKKFRWIAVLLLSCLVSLALGQQLPLPQPIGPVGPTPRPPEFTVKSGVFQSTSLGREMPYRVILPAGYQGTDARYPVLYLLHGLTGNYSDWESRTNIVRYARRFELIIAFPDGNDSWYTNSASVPADKFEDYIAKDFIGHIDKQYRTIATRHARAIAGLSMGGYGALKFGLKYPQLFVFAGSFSGALKATELDVNSKSEKFREMIGKIYGPVGSTTRVENDLFAIAAKADPARMPYFYFDCGTEDGLLASSREFAALLQKSKIPFEYRELPGAHTWSYWDRQVIEMLEVLAQHMKIRPF
jgi:putative tributyrin esterase